MKRKKNPIITIIAYAIIFYCATVNHIFAQNRQLKLDGYFLADSIKIGEPVAFSLSLEHPIDYELIFPDSNYNYFPFELVSKEYFTSKSDSLTTKDSVVYYLSTFELDSYLTYSLPIFIYQNKDSVELFSNIDTIYVKSVLTLSKDEVKLKENTTLQKLLSQFNYPYLLIGIGLIIVILAVLLFVFGKSIKKKIQIYFLNSAHQKFVKDYNVLLNNFERDRNIASIENLLQSWKLYLGQLLDLKIDTYTSKEIFILLQDSRLSQTLTSIDKAIYGGILVPELQTYMSILEEKANEQFEIKLNSIK